MLSCHKCSSPAASSSLQEYLRCAALTHATTGIGCWRCCTPSSCFPDPMCSHHSLPTSQPRTVCQSRHLSPPSEKKTTQYLQDRQNRTRTAAKTTTGDAGSQARLAAVSFPTSPLCQPSLHAEQVTKNQMAWSHGYRLNCWKTAQAQTA